eukprot:CAMPEP_0119224266 /NCGR_PEP_ID=MMETSP1327-20130426/33578_1 /TAXON_ID=38833 /ORGANISM="Micromonas pusilla, Strain RCC2306" /LENGTH=132 /DNA_ID=CAMNT_0007222543 /DNA_START=400 /DNA_END=798 /DNA_ORIENTATION=+
MKTVRDTARGPSTVIMAGVLAAFGNMFAFKGSFQAEVTVGENENGESAIRRFRRAVMNSGHINETRRRRYFENVQDIKKRKQSTPRKKKGGKPRTAAQALAEKEQAASNPGGGRGRGGGGEFRGGGGFRGRD